MEPATTPGAALHTLLPVSHVITTTSHCDY